MGSPAITMERCCTLRASWLICVAVLTVVADPVHAADCSFAPQGEGRVTGIVDARTIRLQDGREVRLAGIEPGVADKDAAEHAGRGAALAAIVAGHDVTLRGADDTPDRYGRQPAFVFSDGSDTSVQQLLLAQGEALVAATVTDRQCAAALSSAEAEARQAGRGIWNGAVVIKNTESPGDILAELGRFTVVEGKFCPSGRPGPRLT